MLFFFSFSSVADPVTRVAARRQTSGIDGSGCARAGNLPARAAPLVGQSMLGIEVLRSNGGVDRITREDFRRRSRAGGRRWNRRLAAEGVVRSRRAGHSWLRIEDELMIGRTVVHIQIAPAHRQTPLGREVVVEQAKHLVVQVRSACAGVTATVMAAFSPRGSMNLAPPRPSTQFADRELPMPEGSKVSVQAQIPIANSRRGHRPSSARRHRAGIRTSA